MAVFLTVHARYKDVQWGIFRDSELVASGADESKKVSKHFIDMLDSLLKNSKLTFSELSFIAAHQGPAPFTTLRVCLATVNGFAFATGIPLVGVNGLEALIEEYKQQNNVTVVLLNAFSGDVYYALYDPVLNTVSYGYADAEKYVMELARTHEGQITFLGNGITLVEPTIKELFAHRAHVLSQDLISLESIAQRALISWNQQEISNQLMPVYLKSYAAKITGSL